MFLICMDGGPIMTLIPAKCTSCGANLTVNPMEDAAVCPFCNTPFIIQKAINHYTQIVTVKADIVNICVEQREFVFVVDDLNVIMELLLK